MPETPLRAGRIAYTNVAPIEAAFSCGAVERSALVTSAPPAKLNALLSSGALDVSPVSAAHFLRNTSDLALFGDFGIVARGAVISVVLVSSRPPALLEGASIAVTRDSASGSALLESLLGGRYGVQATFEGVEDAAAAALGGRPALLIGDAAIAIRDRVPPGDVHDLGAAWFEWTALPMVFAVWAVRRDVLAQRPEQIAHLAEAYSRARAWGAAHRSDVIAAAMAERPRDRAFYERYFSTLTYTIDADARAGLARFAAAIGLPEDSRVAR
ncbi:MAG: menaquinone biosynthesis protein [Candidatus Velthaea sp.]